MTIWIDADACPKMIKDFVFKVSRRLKVPVILVANSSIHTPRSNLVSLVVVGKEIDETDHHILENCAVGDLVITAGCTVMGPSPDGPNGSIYLTSRPKPDRRLVLVMV